MKQAFNRVVNALGLITFIFMISTGSILKWILPPGSGRLEGREAWGREIASYIGLTRHEWGEVHFYISIGFVIILGAHLLLHWNWIKATAWGTARSPQPKSRKLITAGIAAFIVLGLLFPWIGKKEYHAKRELLSQRVADKRIEQ
ncbi:MAG: DUF4405 domain-containing protein [Candidatus Omnitrophica bacterium]|nr:DUF4405 domain-containing protein [Candidatus Omnitrophota bacterium]